MFALKQNIKSVTKLTHVWRPTRTYSTAPLVNVAFDSDGIATVTMQRPPVNSFNLDMLQHLNKALDEVEHSKCTGMILTSSSPTVFSAGLDIMEMYKPDFKRVVTFWTTLQDVWIKLFGSKFITAAAVNGHAPAGACMLAMSCEYRVMVAGNATIGLSEANLGLVVYKWFIDTMSHIISQRQTELAITTGALFTADEALKVGLVDETAINKEAAIEKCKIFIKKFDNISREARALTKLRLREAPLTWLKAHRAEDTREFLRFLSDPQIQQSLAEYVQNMQRKKEAKGNI